MLITADRALLSGLIDYAGLFPPAWLSMADAVAEYRDARASDHGWVLGRFLCPASRLEELAGALMVRLPVGEPPWPVSVILDGEAATAAVLARNFDREMDPAASVMLLEVLLPVAACSTDDPVMAAHEMAPVIAAALSVSPTSTPFFEVTRTTEWRSGIPAALRALASHRDRERRPLGAKLRCGGLERADFPTVEQVVSFMTAARATGVPFKATAGLHHPVRHHDDDLDIMRHGFLNLLVAAALCDAGETGPILSAALEETDELAFSVSPAALRWRDHAVTARAVQQIRTERFASYGSCSFAEPIADLTAMGVLGGVA